MRWGERCLWMPAAPPDADPRLVVLVEPLMRLADDERRERGILSVSPFELDYDPLLAASRAVQLGLRDTYGMPGPGD